MRVRKIGVVGAGAMGAGIAALAASAGVPVVLLDIPGAPGQGDKERSGPARNGLQKTLKAKPAAFMDPARAALVRTGNTEDDLALLADCDLIVEAIIEQPQPKRDLFARIEGLMGEDAVVSSNTSGIPMQVLLEGRGERFRRHFLGTHFFNPPRYMHLLELIPTPETAPEALDTVRRFGERVLGKGIVVAKDAPGFIGNRLGLYGIVQTIRLMEEFDLTIDEVDALTGPLIGRPRSATFRTGDLTGLDVLSHVATGLAQATGEEFGLPDWVRGLVQAGRLGDKTGAGFYRKEGKDILTLDWRSSEYRPQQKVETAELGRLMKLPLPQRLAAIRELEGKYGDFLRRLLVGLSHYTLETTPKLAYDIVAVDRAMEWGYGWEAGPYRVMDALDLTWLRDRFREQGLSQPEPLRKATAGFYRRRDGVEEHLAFDGTYAPVPSLGIQLAAVRSQPGRVLESDESAALLDLGDGVALFELRTKMNTIGEGVLRMLERAQRRVERDGLAGMVIGSDDPRTFAAGADLLAVVQAVQGRQWEVLERSVRAFQEATMSLRRMPFPTVVAPFGLTLGGGAEFALHASGLQAHAELYMGLVEVGVGLIPAGGGTKELLFRFAEELARYEDADPFEGVKRAFGLIALAQTSTSAHEARNFGFLRDGDRISMNRDRLIADAKARVLDLAPDYVAPPPRTVRALGRDGIGNLNYALWSFREAGRASEHDARIGHRVAYVLCGGDGPPRDVTEQDILDLEREAFLELLGTKETQERIAHMLKTGKPLRN
jgi:3-hydroxyacyl-CoA dehydrogenase